MAFVAAVAVSWSSEGEKLSKVVFNVDRGVLNSLSLPHGSLIFFRNRSCSWCGLFGSHIFEGNPLDSSWGNLCCLFSWDVEVLVLEAFSLSFFLADGRYFYCSWLLYSAIAHCSFCYGIRGMWQSPQVTGDFTIYEPCRLNSFFHCEASLLLVFIVFLAWTWAATDVSFF